MLTEEQLEIIGEAIQPLFQYLEQELIKDVARRIKNTMTYTRTAELQAISMQNLGYSPAQIRKEAMRLLNADAKYRKEVAKNTAAYKKEIRKIIQSITNEAYKACDDIVANAGNMSWASDLTVWKQAGKALTDKSFLPQLVKGIQEQTLNEFKNLTQTTGFKTMSGYEAVQDLYRRELDKAVIKICTGTFSQDKVLRDVVHDLAKSGLRTIDFSSGYSMQLDTAARVALRTGCHQLAGRIQNRNILNTDVNLVHVKSHWGARNTGTDHANHEEWQGKVYYIKPADYTAEAQRIGQDSITDLWEATGYSIDGKHTNDPLGLFGYNCRHLYFAFFEGVSRVHEPAKEPGPFNVDGKTYDYYSMTQKLRKMERDIRALKRERDALKSLKMEASEVDVKIQRKIREYEQFCKDCGVPSQTSKLRYESGTADLTKTNAYQEYKNSMR